MDAVDTELPLVRELSPPPDPEAAFRRFHHRPGCLFLDSALRHAERGRYSFLTCDPWERFTAAAGSGDPLAELAPREAAWRRPTVAGLPPFQGGLAGLFSYELGRSLEPVAAPRWDEFQFPALALGWYDTVLAWDHVAGRAWIVSQGFPETEPAAARRRAAERIAQFEHWLGEPPPPFPDVELVRRIEPAAPCHPIGALAGLVSNFRREGYLEAVARGIEYIRAGDVFQVNLAQRLMTTARDHAAALYLRLRQRNPAPFAAYFDWGEFRIASASPERFVQIRGRSVEARPIKGTRGRSGHPAADMYAGEELRESAKDRAENVMIVDLLRNDLSRVCSAESVRVTQLCRLEAYEFVQHLVSAVEGELLPGVGGLDLVRAAFPGGSITGAPKVRAMQIIAELEATARGPYCGSLGYLGFDGSLDLSILIRTITAAGGWWQFPVGGGVVVQSSPEREYEETWQKAAGLLRALDP